MGLFPGSWFGSRDQSHLSDPTANPVGTARVNTLDLGSQLSRFLRSKDDQGFSSAMDVLSREGAVDPRIENAGRADIERQRQMDQQDIAQQSANAGLSGAVGTSALQSSADIGAASRKQDLALNSAFDRADRYRGDIAGIFGGLIQNPSLDLLANRTTKDRNSDASGLDNLFSTAGRAMGAYGSLSGTFGSMGRRQERQ